VAQERARGGKGDAIFDRVNELVEQSGINRSEAFAQIAAETGDRAGSVSANYYRVARRRGGEGIRPRAPRGGGARRGGSRGGGRGGGSATRVIRQAEEALAALSQLARESDRRVEELRRENARYQELRRLIR
jgi:hypothetical protein